MSTSLHVVYSDHKIDLSADEDMLLTTAGDIASVIKLIYTWNHRLPMRRFTYKRTAPSVYSFKVAFQDDRVWEQTFFFIPDDPLDPEIRWDNLSVFRPSEYYPYYTHIRSFLSPPYHAHKLSKLDIKWEPDTP